MASAAAGYTLVELLIATALAAILFTGLGSLMGQALETRDVAREQNDLAEQARFALAHMVRAVSRSPRLLLPLNDNPNTTDLQEHIRAETVPASPPPPGSTKATAVLAVTLDPATDLDGDGTPDADNDGDGLLDEDLPSDILDDSAPGIYLIDDTGEGTVDEFLACCFTDDDEDFGIISEDPVNGLDDDGDGNVDDDPGNDMNADGCPGVCGIDDDADGLLDEGSPADDDEDGQADEDWYDPVVFYLNGGTLVYRTQVPWDTTGDAVTDGWDHHEAPLADNVTTFRVERIPQADGRAIMVDLTLELTDPQTAASVRLQTRVRVGGAL